MGIEPLFLVAILAVMFLVQAGRALHERIADRLQDSLWTWEAVAELTDESALHPELDGIDVQLLYAPWPGTDARRALQEATGVRQRRLGRYLGWLEPSVLVLVRLPTPVVPGLRVSQLPSVVRRPLSLQSPVLDQLLRVSATDPEAARALLADRRVHEPMLEILGRHPLSLVTGDVVALWCAEPVADPASLVDLAVELAEAMVTVSRSHAHRGAEVRGLLGGGPRPDPPGR